MRVKAEKLSSNNIICIYDCVDTIRCFSAASQDGFVISMTVFSERELTFTFAICCRASVCLSSVCLSSVTFVRPTQAVQIFGNISTALDTLAIH